MVGRREVADEVTGEKKQEYYLQFDGNIRNRKKSDGGK